MLVAAFVILGALTFLSLGYVIASFAKTEDAANGMTSVVQFPMMFLSGMFFPIDQMPQFLQVVARLIPLTYLADALRQVMVGGAAFAPLWVCVAVLLGWLVVCFGIAARKFQLAVSAVRRRYQRSSWTISSRARRPPAFGGRVRSVGSAG